MQKCDMALFFYLDAFITSGPLAHTVLGKDVCTESLVDVVFILLLIERLTELCYY